VRFLADENFAGDTVTELRRHGHDVAWVRTDAPGSSDAQVLAWAVAEDRIVITFDKDFGELAFRAGLEASPGVILFRIHQISPSSVTNLVVTAIESRNDWPGHFSVVEESRIRMLALPISEET
jgi:predicted nuclease of predicted toxin-antitoxin system